MIVTRGQGTGPGVSGSPRISHKANAIGAGWWHLGNWAYRPTAYGRHRCPVLLYYSIALVFDKGEHALGQPGHVEMTRRAERARPIYQSKPAVAEKRKGPTPMSKASQIV